MSSAVPASLQVFVLLTVGNCLFSHKGRKSESYKRPVSGKDASRIVIVHCIRLLFDTRKEKKKETIRARRKNRFGESMFAVVFVSVNLPVYPIEATGVQTVQDLQINLSAAYKSYGVCKCVSVMSK